MLAVTAHGQIDVVRQVKRMAAAYG